MGVHFFYWSFLYNIISLYIVFLTSLCLCFLVFMQSEGFKYLEENCQSLVSELLETMALVDKKPGSTSSLSRKRSSSSINGIDLVAEGDVTAAESVNPVARRMRRRL